MITGFNHSGFVVKDIDKMVAFYRDLLGLTVLRDVDSKAPPEGDHTASRARIWGFTPGPEQRGNAPLDTPLLWRPAISRETRAARIGRLR